TTGAGSSCGWSPRGSGARRGRPPPRAFRGHSPAVSPPALPPPGAFPKAAEGSGGGGTPASIPPPPPRRRGAGPPAPRGATAEPQKWIDGLGERVSRGPEPLRIEGGPMEMVDAFVQRVLPGAGFAWLTPEEAAALRATLTPDGIERALGRSLRLLEQSPGLEM